MACISITEFADKYFPEHKNPKRKVYEILRNHKHLKKKVRGMGTLVDETKYQKIVG